MSIGKFCQRKVVTAPRETTIVEAARLMRARHVGDVIVVDAVDGGLRPVGIVTDRDIVVEVVSAALDPALVKVSDLLLEPLVTVVETTSYAETARLLADKGVRRVPVVNEDGLLVGIITFDDLVHQLAVPLADLSVTAQRERRREVERRV